MGPAAPYKLRTVIRQFETPAPANPDVMVPQEELECGHIVLGRNYAQGSKAAAIRELFRDLTGQPIKRKCFECGKASSVTEQVLI